ncbi:hypothetical protein L3Q82_012059, partial [Scortum barcoo]
YSGHIRLGGELRADPEDTAGDYISHAAWEHLGIPQEELQDVVRAAINRKEERQKGEEDERQGY